MEQIATHPVHVAQTDTLAGEAMLQMLELDIHHLPVSDRGRLVGMITDTDLLDLDRGSPFAIRRAISRAPSVGEVVFAARGFSAVVATLVESGGDPIEIGRVISVIGDGATARLVALAIAELGEAPGPFAWLALGSAARHEQALHSDQDHALALGSGFLPDEHDAFFAELAERVTAGLEAIGFPRCRGDAMATSRAMRRSVEDWAQRFRTWIQQPDVDAMILSSIGFDYRTVAGTLDAEPTLDAAVADARANPAFLRLLARIALREEPPTGFLRGLVVQAKGEHAGTLDIKHGGITIVTSIARARGVAAGSPVKDTLGRLEAAVAAGTLRPESGRDLAEAFRFLMEVRLRHQVAQVRAGATPDDFVDPATLGTIERSGLREAFRAIRGEQQLLAFELETGA